MAPPKRVYYFTPHKYALENLRNQRLKVSRFSKCNDPYELAAFNQQDKSLRKRFKKWLADMDKNNGLLCFSRTWRNPVMWSHYAENHTGLCFGFDVDPHIFVDVKYVSERLYPNLSLKNFRSHVGEDQMVDLFATKFIHWSYEEEVRLLIEFSEPVPDHQIEYFGFSDSMRLKEIIVGPKSKIRAKDIGPHVSDSDVNVFKSRLAFQRFEVVRQKIKKKW